MPRKLTKLEFIEKSNITHNNKYNYEKVEYINSKQKVIITCPTHGEFSQQPSNHLQGNGCPKCKVNRIKNKQTMTLSEFIEKANSVHGEKYKYDRVVYRGSHKKIQIKCPIHGYFNQTPSGHLSGCGCKKCANDIQRHILSSNLEEFINNSKIIHKNKYNYDNCVYVNARTKVNIICPKHGIFSQTPYNHLNMKYGCNKCSHEKLTINKTSNKDEFIKKANNIHDDFYNYDDVVYIKSNVKVVIICPIHGSFEKTPNKHISCAQGCPKCKKNESNELKIVDSLLPSLVREKRFDNCVFLRPLPFDRFSPEQNILIEYDGEQHFRYKEKWHRTQSEFENMLKRDTIKTKYAIDNGFNFLRISYKESTKKTLTTFIETIRMYPTKQIIQIYGTISIL